MDELITLVMERLGFDRQQAENAVTIVVEGIKERLPKPFADKLEAVLNGETDIAELLGNIDIGSVNDLLDDVFGGDDATDA